MISTKTNRKKFKHFTFKINKFARLTKIKITNVETQIKTKIICDQFCNNVTILFIRRQFNFQSSKNQKKFYLCISFFFFFHLYIESKNIVAFNKFKNRRSKIAKTIKTRRRKIKFIFVFIFRVIKHVNIENKNN